MRRDLALTAASLGLVATAAVPLHRVFTTTAWRPGVIASVLVATALAVASRRLRLPATVALAVSLAALLAFASRTHATVNGPWPTPAALLELWRLALQGFEEIRLEPAPAAPLDGIRLLLTGGTWVVAHVTHEMLVRLRRPGAGIAVCALLWFTPLAVPITGSPAWPNALPFFVAGGLALLLEPDPDGTGWTREDDQPRLTWSGVALACTAAVVGLLAPWLSPGYAAPALVDVTAATEPRGYQPIVDVGDRLQLPEPRDVLEVRAPRQVYLRLAALDTFDGRTWRLGPPDVQTFRPDPDQLFRAEGAVPFETELLESTRVDVSVEVLDLENIYVPVPYQVASVDGPEDANLFYSLQGGFVATGDVQDNDLEGETRVGVREGFAYEVESAVPTPDYQDLAALGDVSVSSDDPRVALPGDYGEYADLTDQIARESGAASTIDTVLAVQDHFIAADSPFTYSTDVPQLRGDEALRDFVFTSQTGYCEYFATAMAVMLRAADVPARVAVGFLPGEVAEPAEGDGQPATFRVSTSDAHAWVEVFFDQYGWVRMDPTPRGGSAPPTREDLSPLEGAGTVTAQPTAEPTTDQQSGPPEVDRPTDQIIGGGIDDPGTTTDPEPGRGWLALVVGVAVLALLVALAVYLWPRVRHALSRRPRGDPATDVLGAQRRVLETAAHLGVGRARHETVTEAAMRWARDGLVEPDDAATFARLGGQAAFGAGPDADDAATMRRLEHRMIAGFTRVVDVRQRLTAPWRNAGERLAATLGRDDTAP